MKTWAIVLIIVAVVIIGLMILLYFLGKKAQKKQAEQQEMLDAHKQTCSMLIIDKKDDVVTLRNLGATDHDITRIFMLEGRLITVIGAILGIAIGLLLCLLQQQFGFVRMGNADGTFIINAYPVSVHYTDVLIIFVTVIVAGWLAVWYPVRSLSRKLL